MNGLPYYKAYPRDFIEGTIGMPFELKCAYRVVLDLIYMQGGRLPDDARYISGLLGCSVRKWKTIRDELVARDKLQANGEFLTNYRAVSELESLAKLQDKQRENRSRANKNNDLQSPRSRQSEPEPEPDIKETADEGAQARIHSDEPTHRERLLSAMGHDPSGLTATGRHVGNPGDMHEAGRWQSDLGLDEAEQISVVAEVMAKRGPGFLPGSFKYFTPEMQARAARNRAPPLRPVESSAQPTRQRVAIPPIDISDFNPDGTRKSWGSIR